MQAIGQLYQDHPDVAGHGQGHFLEVLCLLLFEGVEFDLGQFGDTVHQLRDRGAELGADGFLGNARVLDHVVQHGGHQALVVHVHVGEDAGDGQWVGYVGFTAAPELPQVGLLGKVIGAFYVIALLRVEITAER